MKISKEEMDLKYINKEISQLATMEAVDCISEYGLEKLKEFRYLKGLHEEKVKKLTIPIEVEDEVRIVKHEKKGKVVYILPFGSDNIAVKDSEGNTGYFKAFSRFGGIYNKRTSR